MRLAACVLAQLIMGLKYASAELRMFCGLRRGLALHQTASSTSVGALTCEQESLAEHAEIAEPREDPEWGRSTSNSVLSAFSASLRETVPIPTLGNFH